MARYWFRPHAYGYGATPVTWEGWALTAGTAAIIGAMTIALVSSDRNDAGLVVPYLVVALALISAVLIVSKRKTDGAWRWRWGQQQK
jgi:hypothetical protein